FWLVAKAGKAGWAVGAKSATKGGGTWFHKTLRGISRAVGFRKGSQVAGGGVQGAATGAAASSSAGWLMDQVLGHTAGLAQATSRGAHKLEAVVGRLTQGAGKVTGKAGAFTPQVFLRDLKFADYDHEPGTSAFEQRSLEIRANVANSFGFQKTVLENLG